MIENSSVTEPISQASLIRTVIDRLQLIIEQAEAETKPLEMEPFRSQLFELFVMADGAAMLDDKLEPNLTSDSIAKILAERWQLRSAAVESMQQDSPLAQESLSRMRLLWSFLRMWMEWTYAWQRWREFHEGDATAE
jgi:hypothetical protein